MEEKDHINGVGSIVLNLQALESLLRGFLVEKYGQCSAFPKMGDKVACRSYLTNFVSLGDLIKDYHRCLEDHERKHRIDESVVLIRDALAHGRLFVRGNDPKPPYELWKFGMANEGKMPVEFSETLTQDWLKSMWLLIDGECQKVVECSKGRGYRRLR
jgi:hypothetical protein